MSTLELTKPVEPTDVRVTKRRLSTGLSDGRTISVPTEWFPRLAYGTPAEWANFELFPNSIRWPHLNEDIGIDGLLRGERSGESAKSIQRWLSFRARGK